MPLLFCQEAEPNSSKKKKDLPSKDFREQKDCFRCEISCSNFWSSKIPNFQNRML